MRENHHKTLGVAAGASLAEIKAAYRKLVKKHHPDRNAGSAESTRRFLEIQRAYESLLHRKSRIDEKPAEPPPPQGRQKGQGRTKSSARATLLSSTLTLAPFQQRYGCYKVFQYEYWHACAACDGGGTTVAGTACAACDGLGRARDFLRYKVRIPPGATEGARYRFAAQRHDTLLDTPELEITVALARESAPKRALRMAFSPFVFLWDCTGKYNKAALFAGLLAALYSTSYLFEKSSALPAVVFDLPRALGVFIGKGYFIAYDISRTIVGAAFGYKSWSLFMKGEMQPVGAMGATWAVPAIVGFLLLAAALEEARRGQYRAAGAFAFSLALYAALLFTPAHLCLIALAGAALPMLMGCLCLHLLVCDRYLDEDQALATTLMGALLTVFTLSLFTGFAEDSAAQWAIDTRNAAIYIIEDLQTLSDVTHLEIPTIAHGLLWAFWGMFLFPFLRQGWAARRIAE